MRIISGKLKGHSINFIKSLKTRPLKDSVKENIFNMMDHNKDLDVEIKLANVLDLYSGFGSFGLECISRGAKRVTFVEEDHNVIKTLKSNLSKLSIKSEAKIIQSKVEELNFNNKEKYQIFFLDPPYKDASFLKNLNKIKDFKIFDKYHLVVIHREKDSIDLLQNLIHIKKEKIYGRSKIIFGEFK